MATRNLVPRATGEGSIGTDAKQWNELNVRKAYASNNIIIFANVAEMKASNKVKVGYTLKTLGYYSPNDGGGAEYVVVDDIGDSEIDDGSIIALQKGLYAKLLISDYVNVKQFGAYGDGEHDDTEAIQMCINFVLNKKGILYIPSGVYYVTNSIIVQKGGVAEIQIIGYGATITTDKNINLLIVCGVKNIEGEITRIQRVVIEGLWLQNSVSAVGYGLYMYYYGAEIRFRHLMCYRFNYAIYIEEGSEFVCEGVECAGSNFGGYYGGSQYPPELDAQGTYFLNCYFHNNLNANLVINNCLEAYLIGGSYMSVSNSSSYGGIYIDNSVNANITICCINFEQGSTPTIYCNNSCLNLVFSKNQVAPSVRNANIIYVKQSTGTNSQITIENNTNDSNICRWLYLASTVSLSLTFSIKNNAPFRHVAFFDDRNIDNLLFYDLGQTSLYPYREEIASMEFTPFPFGVTEFSPVNDKLPVIGAAIYQIGTISSSEYMVLAPLKTGDIVFMDMIIGSSDGGDNVLSALTFANASMQEKVIDLNGNNLIRSHIYSNGLSRIMCYLKAPQDGELRLSNQWYINSKLWVERASIYTSRKIDYPKQPRLNIAPTVNKHIKGTIVYNNNPSIGSPIGWVCVQEGIPGTWSSFGTIS